MEYAVISFRNNQHLVKTGAQITSLGEVGAVGDIITDVQTLLVKDNDLQIGEPTVEYPIHLKVVEITKTDKVEVYKYKGKSRYRRHTGHRQAQTILEVVAAGTEKKTEKVAKEVKIAKQEVEPKVVKVVKEAKALKAPKKASTTK